MTRLMKGTAFCTCPLHKMAFAEVRAGEGTRGQRGHESCKWGWLHGPSPKVLALPAGRSGNSAECESPVRREDAAVPPLVNYELRRLMTEAGFSSGGLARRVGTSTTQVGRWRDGQQPRRLEEAERVRRVFSDRLGRLVTLTDLGFTVGEKKPSLEGVEGSALRLWRIDAATENLLALPFAPEALDRPVMDWVIGSSAIPFPTQRTGQVVTEHDVRMASDMLSMFRKLDHTYGAGQLRGQVVNYLATEVSRLLSRPTTDQRTEMALMTIAAGICEMVGYQAVDIGANGLAQRYYLAAIGFAQASGDRAYGAHLVAANVAHLALHVGHPAEALRMVQAAQHGGQSAASPAAQAAFCAVEARAYARMKNEKACAAALAEAEAALAKSVPTAEPDWISYFTPADLEEETAHCMYDLDRHEQAQHIVRTAVNDLDPTRVRRLAIDTALLATSLAASGQLEEACAVGRDAVDYAARTNSFRCVLRINDMRQALAPFAGHHSVADLENLVREVLPRATSAETLDQR